MDSTYYFQDDKQWNRSKHFDAVSYHTAEFSCSHFWNFADRMFGSLTHSIMLSANRDRLTSSFSICIPLIFFSFLIVLVNIWKYYWNNGDSVHPCVISNFSEIASNFSLFKMMLTTDFFCISFIRVSMCGLKSSKNFINKVHWILLRAFSMYVEMIMWFSSLSPFCGLLHLWTWVYWTIPIFHG